MVNKPITFSRVDDSQLVALLQQGAIGVLPTDTVYGLVCRAVDQTAVAKLYDLNVTISPVRSLPPVLAS